MPNLLPVLQCTELLLLLLLLQVIAAAAAAAGIQDRVSQKGNEREKKGSKKKGNSEEM